MKSFIVVLAIVGLAFGSPRINAKINPKIKFDGKIVHGQDASITELPYQASVTYHNDPICGGSIINDHIVLTAAHCTHKMKLEYFGVHVGTTDVFDDYGQYVTIAKIVQHEDYDPVATNNDMSLLILSTPLKFNIRVQPIQLNPNPPADGAVATVSGWGTTSENGDISATLKKLEVPIINFDRCNQLYRGTLTANMLCAGYEDGYYDSCQGDSGGPLAVDGKLVGVVSFGIGCARPGYPGVYASVAHMYDWIATNVDAN